MPTRWRTRLIYTEPQVIVFAGGRMSLRFRAKPEGSVQYVGRDFVAVMWSGLLVVVPFAAIWRVMGPRRRRHNSVANRTLYGLLQSWVDPLVNPDAPGTLLWHSFVDHGGGRHHGVIRRVDGQRGLLLRLTRGRTGWLPWHRLAAATEIME